jgi:hypothetical protein
VVPASPFCGIQPKSSYNLLLSRFNKLTAIFVQSRGFLDVFIMKDLNEYKNSTTRGFLITVGRIRIHVDPDKGGG